MNLKAAIDDINHLIQNSGLYEIFLAKAFNPLGAVVAALSLFLLGMYRNSFAGLQTKPSIS